MNIEHLAHLTCPEPLKDLPGWLVWKFEPNGDQKPRKVPHYARGGRRQGAQGSKEDRAQLVTFNAARAAAARGGFDGIGFALMPEFNIVALDFDYCVKNGKLDPYVESLVSDTYAELSPSGLGVRAFMVGDLGNKKSQANALQYGFETFSSKGFVTLTGEVLDICKLVGNENHIAPVSLDVSKLCALRFGEQDEAVESGTQEPLGVAKSTLSEMLDVIAPEGYDLWLKVGMCLHHETGGSDEGCWRAFKNDHLCALNFDQAFIRCRLLHRCG
ncbi:MAG: PriCT-2 domain-containing protein [Methylococcaceae bacterium]|nr:PriCT-2 domain-containing protein [Methylococcaceae bacterium]